jgi:hypothetical protein
VQQAQDIKKKASGIARQNRSEAELDEVNLAD